MSEDAHELNNTKLFLENTEFQFFFSKFQMSEWSASVSSLKIPVDVFSNFSTQSSCTTTCCTHAPPPATAWPPATSGVRLAPASYRPSTTRSRRSHLACRGLRPSLTHAIALISSHAAAPARRAPCCPTDFAPTRRRPAGPARCSRGPAPPL